MVNDDFKFETVTELYNRLIPALKSKNKELSREGFFYIREIDIWNYLIQNKWRNKRDLRLFELVNDIFDCDGLKVAKFVKEHNSDFNRYNDGNDLNAG